MMRILTLSKTEVGYKRLTMKSEKTFLFVLNVNVTWHNFDDSYDK